MNKTTTNTNKFVFALSMMGWLSAACFTPPSRSAMFVPQHPTSGNNSGDVQMDNAPPPPVASSNPQKGKEEDDTCGKKCQQLIRISKRAASDVAEVAKNAAIEGANAALDAVEQWQTEKDKNSNDKK